MNEAQRKKKLLSKYADPVASKKKANAQVYNDQNVWMKDQDQIMKSASSYQSQESVQQQGKGRIASSNEEDQVEDRKQLKRKKQQKQAKKQKKLKKKLRKALGLGKNEQVQQFLSNLQVQGIEKNQILDYLKKNKQVIIKKQDVKVEQDNKKKKKKKDKKEQNEDNKFQMFQKSQSSDLQIPEQARAKTIYRNKDGTIRETSQKQQKQKRKKQILQRLSQWQKGMKKQKSDDEHENIHEDVEHAQNNKIWDDPMKRWQMKNPMKLLVCKYQGAPNRYGIKPGYRWDGVVRGNGFQNRYLQQINLKKAKKDQQHRQFMKDL